MSKGNENKNVVIKEIEDKIWNIVTFLKNEKFRTDDYYVVLLLLSLYKDQLITNKIEFEKEKIIDALLEHFNKSNNDKYTLYQPIIESYKANLLQLSDLGVSQILSFLFDIDQKELSLIFPEIFDKILYKITQSHGRYAGEFIQPIEISQFFCAIAELPKKAKVYNPFAGLASFGVYFGQDIDYFGQELKRDTWALGKLRLLAHNKPEAYKYKCEDSIFNWPDSSTKFDLIVSNPPFGVRLRPQSMDIEFESRTIEHFLIEKGLQSLTQTGKLITILPQGFLFRGGQVQRLREYLVEEDLIDAIISLPGGILLNTGIPLSIMILSKAKKIPGKVKFIDAKSFVISNGSRQKILNEYSLRSFIDSEKEIQNVVRIVDNEQICINNYNLSVSRYFQKQIEGVKLGKILEPVRGRRSNLPEVGKLIRIRDLKDDKVDFMLDVSSIEESELSRPDIHLLSETCLILALRWPTLRPTLFEFKEIPVFRTHDILSFKVKEEIADIAYLINELHANYVQDQIDSYRIGSSVMPIIRKDDLMEVVIKLPSLEEQRAKVQEAYLAFAESKESEILFIKAVFNEELREKQHCIRHHLKNVIDSIAVINSFMEQQNGTINKNDIINPQRNLTVAQRFEAMSKSMSSLSIEIDNLTNDELYDKPDLIGIRNLLKECIYEYGNTNGFDIQETYDEPALNEYGVSNPNISISKRSFKELYNNIIINATKHGFVDANKEYLIDINVTIEDEKLKLSFLNNGRPFVEGMSKQLGIKGKKAGINAGSGIGVWKIFEIAKQYNFECRVLDNPEDYFPVGWEFKFTLIDKI